MSGALVVAAPSASTELAPDGVQWTHADASQTKRGQFALLPTTNTSCAVITKVSGSSEATLTIGLTSKGARELCGMNGDGVAWIEVPELIASALEGRAQKWHRRAADVVQVHYNPRSRPAAGMLVAMQTERTGREKYVVGFYDHNEEAWCMLTPPSFHRALMPEGPIRWCSIHDAARSGLKEYRG